MTDTSWEALPPERQEMMSLEFWASLSEEERQERLTWPTDDISPDAKKAVTDGPE